MKGNSLSIKILEEVYQSGLSNCDNYLHGRLVLSRGDKPFSSIELARKTLAIMETYRPMEDDSLGSGFF
jgi:hypothetical protein